jgi:RHS repeat-associated protein
VANPGPRASYTQAYNRAGNRLTEASTITGDPSDGTAAMGYDPLGRLVSYSAPGRTLAATFDAVPNRTTLATDGTPVTTTFDAANRPTSGGYTYDADGRMTARPGQALAWDSLGRLAEVRTSPGGVLVARYGYDALDRLWTVERPGQATIRFRYAGTSTAVAQVVDDTSGTVIRNVTTGPAGTVLQDWTGTSQRLYGTNGHHDTTFTTGDAGTVTATLRYDPWGNVTSSTGPQPDWRFQGSWADTATRLAWSVARWYDPSQGTFISEDTLLGDPASPPSRHLYAYAEGDPVGGWDPGGRVKSATWSFATSRPYGRAWSSEPGTWVGNEVGKLGMNARAHSQGVTWVDSAAEASIRSIRRTPLLSVAQRSGKWHWTMKANASYGKTWDALAVFGGVEVAVRVEYSVYSFSTETTLRKRSDIGILTKQVGCGYVLIGQLNRCSDGFGFDSGGVDEIASGSFVPPRGSVGPSDRIGVGLRASTGVTAWFAWGETTLRLSDISFRITWGL